MADRTCSDCGQIFQFPALLTRHQGRKVPCAPKRKPPDRLILVGRKTPAPDGENKILNEPSHILALEDPIRRVWWNGAYEQRTVKFTLAGRPVGIPNGYKLGVNVYQGGAQAPALTMTGYAAYFTVDEMIQIVQVQDSTITADGTGNKSLRLTLLDELGNHAKIPAWGAAIQIEWQTSQT